MSTEYHPVLLCMFFALLSICHAHTRVLINKQTKTNSLRTPACERQNSSYRSTLTIKPGGWTTVRLPFSDFKGYGPGPDTKQFEPRVRRLAVVAIGEAKDVVLAVAKVGFYKVF